MKKTFFTIRVMRHQKSLSREAVDVSSLEVLKDRLDGALSIFLVMGDGTS